MFHVLWVFKFLVIILNSFWLLLILLTHFYSAIFFHFWFEQWFLFIINNIYTEHILVVENLPTMYAKLCLNTSNTHMHRKHIYIYVMVCVVKYDKKFTYSWNYGSQIWLIVHLYTILLWAFASFSVQRQFGEVCIICCYLILICQAHHPSSFQSKFPSTILSSSLTFLFWICLFPGSLNLTHLYLLPLKFWLTFVVYSDLFIP